MPGMSKSARNPTVMMLNQIEIHPPTWCTMILINMEMKDEESLEVTGYPGSYKFGVIWTVDTRMKTAS